MCRILRISEFGYYRWLKTKDKPTKQELLLVEIKDVLDEHEDNDNYGVPRMQIALEERGIKYSKSTIRRAMRAGGYLHKRRKPKGLTKATTEIQNTRKPDQTRLYCRQTYEKAAYRYIRNTLHGWQRKTI